QIQPKPALQRRFSQNALYWGQGRPNGRSPSRVCQQHIRRSRMALGKTAIRGGLAALMVALMRVGAEAWDAVATTSLNVRSGPGTQYRVVKVLQRGERVDVEYCRSGWCFLDMGWNGNGWASQNYLAQAGAWQPPRPQPQPPQWRPNPPRPQPPHWNP